MKTAKRTAVAGFLSLIGVVATAMPAAADSSPPWELPSTVFLYANPAAGSTAPCVHHYGYLATGTYYPDHYLSGNERVLGVGSWVGTAGYYDWWSCIDPVKGGYIYHDTLSNGTNIVMNRWSPGTPESVSVSSNGYYSADSLLHHQ